MCTLTGHNGDDGGGLHQLVGCTSLASAGLALLGRPQVHNEEDDKVHRLNHQRTCDDQLCDHKPPCTHNKDIVADKEEMIWKTSCKHIIIILEVLYIDVSPWLLIMKTKC